MKFNEIFDFTPEVHYLD